MKGQSEKVLFMWAFTKRPYTKHSKTLDYQGNKI